MRCSSPNSSTSLDRLEEGVVYIKGAGSEGARVKRSLAPARDIEMDQQAREAPVQFNGNCQLTHSNTALHLMSFSTAGVIAARRTTGGPHSARAAPILYIYTILSIPNRHFCRQFHDFYEPLSFVWNFNLY